jgi:hypothetical protein
MDYNAMPATTLHRIAKERCIVVRKQKKEDLIVELEAWDAIQLRAKDKCEGEGKSDSRRGGLRRQREAVDPVESLEYPFSFIRNGEYDRTCEPIPGHPAEDIGAFPDNIAEYLWIYEGTNDERPWLCLCRLDTDIYVYFRGECDYTGFDCQGNMEIYAHRDPNILIQMAMTSTDYDLYLANTLELE